MAKKVGEVLRQARLDAGLSLRDIERLSGMPAAQLSQIESGVRADPAFTTIARFARTLGISLDTIASRCGVSVSPESSPAKGGNGYAKSLAELDRAKRAALQTLTRIEAAATALVPREQQPAKRRKRS